MQKEKIIKVIIFFVSGVFLLLCRYSVESMVMVAVGAGMMILITNQYGFQDNYYSSWLGRTFYPSDTEKARVKGYCLDLFFWGLFMCAGVFHALK